MERPLTLHYTTLYLPYIATTNSKHSEKFSTRTLDTVCRVRIVSHMNVSYA